jgi:DNA-binding SARP family transcriptional activator
VDVDVRLLDGFSVRLGGVPVPGAAWHRRKSAELVQLLALAPGARLHRERVVHALWPDLLLEQALPRLHKAAHFARRALSTAPGAIELQQDMVALAPGHALRVDAVEFEAAARRALDREPPDVRACAQLVADRAPVLLPDTVEDWVEEHRDRYRLLVEQLLVAAERWEAVLRLDPVNEAAHLGLLRSALRRGDRAAGLQTFASMERVLAEELQATPGPDAVALRDALISLDVAQAAEPTAPARARGALVERGRELGSLRAGVAAATATGHGSVALVSGDAGVGKSALVRALVDGLPDGVAAHVGGCDDLLAPRSLGPFQDIVADAGDADVRATVQGGTMDEVLPALLAFLGRGPCVAVVEDLHWADDATLDAVRYLARRVTHLPVVLVATFRSRGLAGDHPLTRLLGSLLGDHVLRLPLEPLSVGAVRDLGGFGDDEAAEVHRITGGNPFFVTEVIAAGVDAVPTTVRDAVLGRIAGLAPEVRELLRTLSVVPGRAERWLAESLATGSEALVAAEASGVLLGEPDSLSFHHELARRAVESSLTATERRGAHRAVLDALLDVPGVSRARLVHHAAFGGRDRVLVEVGPEAAADAARQGAHRQSAEILRLVLEGPLALTDHLAARLWTERSYSSYVVNRFEAAFTCAETAVALADRSTDRRMLMDALSVLARAAMFARGPEAARAAAERAVEVARHEGNAEHLSAALTELARAHSNLPSVAVVAQPSSACEQAAAEALAIALRLDRPELVARSLCYRGEARMSRGDLDGFGDLERGVELAVGDPRLETRVRCLVNAAGAAFRVGRLADVERLVAAGLGLAEECEFFAGQYRLRLTRAAARASHGAWDSAVAELEDLLRSPGEPGIMAPLARSILARLLARRGDPRAGAVLTAARADQRRTRSGFIAGVLEVVDAELGWLDGSLAEASPAASAALCRMAADGYTGVAAELTAYLRRADVPVPAPGEPPGPWAPTLAERPTEAAAAWARIGERYERAVVLAGSGDPAQRDEGLAALVDLGAVATLAAVG